jgi:hypothetical protein
VAPAAFDAILEYPLVLVIALLLRRPAANAEGVASPAIGAERRARLLDLLVPFAVFMGILLLLVVLTRVGQGAALNRLVVAVAVVAALLAMRRPRRFAMTIAAVLAITYFGGEPVLFADRTFFGLNRVIDDGAGHRIYLSGSTIHGVERTDPDGGRQPLSYYHPTGPAGQIFQALPSGGAAGGSAAGAATDVAIIGLGAGGLAAYGQPGQHYTFVEIDPVVIRIARDPALFRFITESPARIDIAEADGRLWLAAQPAGTFDLIVLDAFSSDAVPAHLLTREAIEMYLTKLRPGGRLMFNTSNSYLDVRSVVVGSAGALGLAGFTRHDADLTLAPAGDKEVSEFVVVSRDAAALGELADDPRWTPIADVDRRVIWTDDFSDILGVLK